MTANRPSDDVPLHPPPMWNRLIVALGDYPADLCPGCSSEAVKPATPVAADELLMKRTLAEEQVFLPPEFVDDKLRIIKDEDVPF